jgi:hypothetical protein
MKKPHKHAELIKAWADGAEIQWFDECDQEWWDTSTPSWKAHVEFRIKPEPKPDVVYYGVCDQEAARLRVTELEWCFTKLNDEGDLIKLTFDGETGKLKTAEVL